MPDKRLKQFEKSFKNKIDELGALSQKEVLERYGSYGKITLAGQTKGYQEALKMLYEIYPELKENK